MPEIANALLAVWGSLLAIFVVLVSASTALWASVDEQRKANAISERMAKIMEGK